MPGRPSNRHVALLRGINVGGKNRLPMATLRGMFEAAGAAEIATYIQSGNVIFTAPARQAAKIAEAVRAALAEELGRTIPLVIRSGRAMAAVAQAHPFADAVAEAKLLMVGFCDREPSAARVAALDPDRSPGDLLEVRGAEVYLAFPNGAGRSKLDAAWLDRSLGVVSTWRNWLTVQRLAELSAA